MNLIEAKELAKKNVAIRNNVSGRLGGKIAVVTGGAQGFGYGIAEELYREGASVVLADINEELAKASAEKLGERAVGIKVDVSSPSSVEELVIRTVEALGGIDIFIANAGVLKAGSLEELTPEQFDFVTKVNYTGYFYCVKYASEIMK
ncbi:MAG: SDR family oxidoreductase, partial [Clostridia bacterium]|nr:SDR family oxidoreductase [Clostridia bacterium]